MVTKLKICTLGFACNYYYVYSKTTIIDIIIAHRLDWKPSLFNFGLDVFDRRVIAHINTAIRWQRPNKNTSLKLLSNSLEPNRLECIILMASNGLCDLFTAPRVTSHAHRTSHIIQMLSHFPFWYCIHGIAPRCLHTNTVEMRSHDSKHRKHHLEGKRLFTCVRRRKKLFDLCAYRMKNSQLNSAYRRINMFNMFIHSNEFAIVVVNIIF